MDGLDKQKLLVILGPTASGKTSFAIHLAKEYNGEIISADSMQIYRGLDIGTAKATAEERKEAVHHLIDIAEPTVQYSVADFIPLAQQKITEIASRGRLPILCGGTGLYISTLVNGITFTAEIDDVSVRQALKAELADLGSAAMLDKLRTVDPVYAAKLHENDHNRVLRALELFQKTGKTMSQQLASSRPAKPPYEVLLLGLDFESREMLYSHINHRVDVMLRQGMTDEALRVYQHRAEWKTAAQAIGYKELFPFFEEKDSIENCTEKLKQATRNYAKRQLSWFHRMQDIVWLDARHPLADATVSAFLADINSI